MSAGVEAPPVLVAEEIHKRYGGVRALRGAHLTLQADQIHGLCGENGSGKSTLLKIISGQTRRDAGRVLLAGEEVEFGDPSEALAAGIATVTQETTLVPELSVTENIFLGRQKPRTWRGIDWAATRQRARQVLASLDCDVDPGAPAGDLRPNQQQMVEIARALSASASVLILDEPTSSLTDEEVEALFRAVRALKGSGIATVFVSHRLSEVFELADRITVLRDGEVVGGGPTGDLDQRRLIFLMIGRELEELSLEYEGRPVTDPVLRVRDLTVPGHVESVDLDVGRGEAVGLAGLVGAGTGEVLSALFGLEPDASGEVILEGARLGLRGPLEAIRAGMGLVPADRKRLGLVLDMSVRNNVVMPKTSFLGRYRRPRSAEENTAVTTAVRDFEIVLDAPAAPVSQLSGGNQQKVVLAKWFETQPTLLLLDQPTRGVDVGAKASIYRLLHEAKQRGLSLLISSSEVSELQLLCDRILVMYRGRMVGEVTREHSDEAVITRLAMGHHT